LAISARFAIIHRIRRARRTEGPDGDIIEPITIPWGGPCGAGAYRVPTAACSIEHRCCRQRHGRSAHKPGSRHSAGTLYPGTHFVTPLLETVQTFDLRDHLFTAGVVDGGPRTSAQKGGLNVQSREGLNIGLAVTVR